MGSSDFVFGFYLVPISEMKKIIVIQLTGWQPSLPGTRKPEKQ